MKKILAILLLAVMPVLPVQAEENISTQLIMLDINGNLLGMANCPVKDGEYYIPAEWLADVITYGGKTYLSATALANTAGGSAQYSNADMTLYVGLGKSGEETAAQPAIWEQMIGTWTCTDGVLPIVIFSYMSECKMIVGDEIFDCTWKMPDDKNIFLEQNGSYFYGTIENGVFSLDLGGLELRFTKVLSVDR